MPRRYRRWPSHRAWLWTRFGVAAGQLNEEEKLLSAIFHAGESDWLGAWQRDSPPPVGTSGCPMPQHMPPLRPTAEDVARWEPYHCP